MNIPLYQLFGLFNISNWYKAYFQDRLNVVHILPKETIELLSVAVAFNQVERKATIPKKETVHSFRDSFAAHLCENGTDLHYIHSLLGRESRKNLALYTHRTTMGVGQLKSPIELLDL